MIYANIQSIPKKELHCHLSGSIPLDTIRHIVLENNIQIPDNFKYPDELFIKTRVPNMQAYFRPWAFLKKLSVSERAIQLMILGALNSFKKDSIEYCEFRFSPFTLVQNAGISINTGLRYLIDACMFATNHTGISAKLVLTLERFNYDVFFAEKLYAGLGAVNDKSVIVGVDITGDEQFLLPNEACLFFRKCKDKLGLGITVHAGETGNVENIRQAIIDLGADRIGHGTALLNDENLIELVLNREICIELCLQSNYLASNVSSLESHPVHKFIEYDIPFVLCADNPAVHNFSLSQEYELFLRLTKREDIIRQMVVRQSKYAFS